MARRSLAKRLWYRTLQTGCQLLGVALFRVRCGGRELMPSTGPALVLANHQSHLDPMLIGLASPRQLNFLARKTLFRFAPFRWLIQSLDAISLDRDGVGLGGLKETLRRLKADEAVLIFPEGTRSRDGAIAPLKPGFCALARRAGARLVPAGIDGAYDAWPRRHTLPGIASIHVQFGPPLLPEEVASLDDAALVAEVEHRIRACHATARASRLRAMAP